jgi:BirA family transcriptional regulator, biotin operon repressor / biotin---[acetyl-CoA-carboxylase] ligase
MLDALVSMPHDASDAYLDADAIRASTFIRHVEIHDTIGSTNDRAARLARDVEIELPALIAARHQTAGRGRGKNVWWSADGALTFSVLLNPATVGIGTANWPQLSLAAAVAICDALVSQVGWAPPATMAHGSIVGGAYRSRVDQQFEIRNPKSSSRFAIKWPNDVMLDDAKVGGILVESPGGGAPAKNCVIVGIGININNSWQSAPHDLSSRGTSLCDATGLQHSLQSAIVRILGAIKDRLDDLSAGDHRLPRTWQRLCWLSQKQVRIDVGSRMIEGTCAGIAVDGALLVKTFTSTERVYGGAVELIE